MSESRDDRLESAQEWLALAEDDLTVARRSLEPPALPALACYHAQQAAEKAVKGYLASLSDERIPRVHEFRDLLALVAERGGLWEMGQSLEPLQPYAVDVRYPGLAPPSTEEAHRAVALAAEAVSTARAACGLTAPGPEGPTQ